MSNNLEICKILLEMDFAGIGGCLGFGLVPLFYYYFYCNRMVGFIYIGANIVGAVSFSYYSIKLQFTKEKLNLFKYITLTIYGIGSIAGLTHIILE